MGRALLLALTVVSPALASAEKRPLAELPYTPSLEPGYLDRSADPCADLYQFACGGWMERNPIPEDQASWSVYGKLYDENQQYLWGLLAEAAKPDPGRAPHVRRVGDYFASCMDEAGIEARGIEPVEEDLAAIDALTSKEGIAAVVGRLHRGATDRGMVFGFGAEQDAKRTTRVIAQLDAGGLGLPDRDYYLEADPKSVEMRERYRAHVAATLRLAGADDRKAEEGAAAVLAIETALAKASLTRVQKRDPYRIYHLMTAPKLRKLAPGFDWTAYFAAVGAGAVEEVNVSEPEFVRALSAEIAVVPLDAWRTYLRWHLLRSKSDYLPAAFVDEHFAFYRAYLRGVKAKPPRWKTCVGLVDEQLGEALGRLFVERTFSREIKDEATAMVRGIREAMAARIEGLDWMGKATKDKAEEKLAKMRDKVGYPAKWRDYGGLEIDRASFLANVDRAAGFETRRQLSKIGKPVDRDEWGMTPPTVNAYYNPLMNDMNFPAGVLLPPLYDLRLDDAPSYGDTGATIGHELIHGFDDEGRQFDADGNLKDWWSRSDGEEFDRRAQCVVDQYAKYPVVDDVTINSRLTLGEDVADLGGTILAWEAWKKAVEGKTLEPRDGLSPEQRFFVGFAQWACNNQRPENLRVRAKTDPHSPGRWRINGVVANMPEFARAFSCPADAPLVREKVCRIW